MHGFKGFKDATEAHDRGVALAQMYRLRMSSCYSIAMQKLTKKDLIDLEAQRATEEEELILDVKRFTAKGLAAAFKDINVSVKDTPWIPIPNGAKRNTCF